MLEINIKYLTVANYALVNNNMPLCQSAEVVNKGTAAQHNVILECTGDYIESFTTSAIDVLSAGASLRFQKFDIKPDLSKIKSLTEKVSTSFTVVAFADVNSEETKHEIARKEFSIDILPYDHWLGTTILPQSVVSFVTPRHPAIDSIVVKAANILKQLTGSSAFTEYQSGNPNEVIKQIAAIYGALHNENIVYRVAPASYEQVGQVISLPDQVLQTKIGNCIDLTLLFASVLENVGINSGIVMQRGHAYLAIWLVDDSCRYSVCDDSSYIEKKCSKGIDEMIVIECTQLTAENTSFEEAQQMAMKHLADTSIFEMFIDIRRCRFEGIKPLPERILNNGVWEIKPSNGVEHEECVLDLREHSRYDLTKVMVNKQQLTKLDIWERKLLDFSLRNSMLNLYLRQKAIQFISFDVNTIEDNLQEGTEYLITCKPNIDINIPDEERLVRSKLLPEMHDLVINDINHKTLHTYHTDTETRNTLKNIYRAARNAIEETGANSLYLAIGVLRWYETEKSENARYAPILMLPVEMVYKKGEYYFRTNDEDISLNITLLEFLRQNYDISIPGLNPMPKDEHGVDVSLIFAIIREALKNQKRWDVEEECILGVFSFSKFLMWNDVHNHRDQLMENNIVSSLVNQRLMWQPDPLISDLKSADKKFKPEDLALPVAVDSSQMSAVIEAGEGHSFILYGPPGTGKSQTITNLVANALFQGKRVLFVAEKMAALSVVQKRLEKIGLGPFCLEMHSNKITKRHVLNQLAMALNVTHIKKPEEYQHTAELLYKERMKMIEHIDALHTTDAAGFSLYDCILRYESIAADTLGVDTSSDVLKKNFTTTTASTYEHILDVKMKAVIGFVGQPSQHPLLGLNIEESNLADPKALASTLAKAKETVSQRLAEYAALSKAGALRDEALTHCPNDKILAENIDSLSDEWRSIRVKWFLPRWLAKRKFMQKLRDFNPYIIEDEVENFLAKLSEYKKLHDRIVDLHAILDKHFGIKKQGDEVPTDAEMSQYIDKLGKWETNTSMYKDWYQWCAYRKELSGMGLDALVAYVESNEISPSTIKNAFMKTLYKHMAEEKIAASSILRTFEGSIFDETVTHYRKLTDDFQMLCQKELYARLAAQIPHVTDNIDSSSEIGLLNRNISNGGRGLSLRDLMDQIPTLLPRLCPVMLMSPMSVAQYLDLSQEKFDLVVFDEASQMPTSEAVGAIARGKALIVVGDPKQMPPTSFFSSTSVNEDEADIDDMESILEDCRTLEIPSLQLNWHYRSKHESLIAFSNNEYYDGSLITFPSVDDQQTKVTFVPVDGVYDKGGKRSNRKEAEAIVDEIARRLQAPNHADRSIGVIAFSVVQQNLIEDLLQERLDNDSKLREAADEIYEPIFIKNLENAQGDERDIILFSIGYGPDKDGKVSMNFGPLNNAGGERRLNVAVSRARREMMVFSTLRASQIDLRRTQARGVEGLKHFLEYAEQQILIQSNSIKNESADTVLSEQIADALRAKGYTVKTNIGRSQFKVDVAICDSNNADVYSLGILLDGKHYNSTQTTRDREIVQPSVLEGLKWRVMRVWSVDWINTPERVLARIEEAYKSVPKTEAKPEKQVFDISNEEVAEAESNALEYKTYSPTTKSAKMSTHALMEAILKVEQPVTLNYLCRQICKCKSIARVTPTLQNEVYEEAYKRFALDDVNGETTIWLDKESKSSFVGYRQNSGRDITDIPMIEISNVVLEAVKEQFSINKDSLSLIAAKKLGFTRRGPKVEQALNSALEQLIKDGSIIEANGKLTVNA